jgi:DNA-nicking Smr family endonuclease
VDRAHLLRLRRGEVEVERRLDLHGMTAAEARRAFGAALREAAAAGERCMLVVHGRGLRSEGGPVLKEGVVEWLTAPPLAPLVLAFASALPRDGGAGASYVLLRRRRAG